MAQPARGSELDNGPDMPPPPDCPPDTVREARDRAITAAADAFTHALREGHLQPLSPTYLTKQYVQGEIDESIRTYNEEIHSIRTGDAAVGEPRDKLVELAGGIDALQTLRYKIFGQALSLEGS